MNYVVTVPIAGSISIIIENVADSEEAREKARELEDSWPDCLDPEKNKRCKWDLDALEAYEKIVEGNVCNVDCLEIDVAEIE